MANDGCVPVQENDTPRLVVLLPGRGPKNSKGYGYGRAQRAAVVV
jgi:hypothetical protein